ncbi:MAG TPA: DNA polymerase ligase N-terminal domain-containing protein [Candidatus Limnocylindrales bacterium]|nr:DNA polymerase ligase N-terminal domain-containing protein [Candidatus Limnocylindrales bacterium]
MPDRLTTYRKKRDFNKTDEPEGRPVKRRSRRPIFVVQLHDASSLHHDFRLEDEGVLKSWAVPKGPSTDPKDKRLAVPTEDHPMEYKSFEGTIAEGEYGAGTVIVWDTGTFRNTSHDKGGKEIPLADALRRGHASFFLEGKKLRGGFALNRFRKQGGREMWLLVKESDQYAGGKLSDESVLTGRRL